jgi:hypothetical protein
LIRFLVVINFGMVAIHIHEIHGVTPCSSNHLRIETTAPLSVSGDGWGL